MSDRPVELWTDERYEAAIARAYAAKDFDAVHRLRRAQDDAQRQRRKAALDAVDSPLADTLMAAVLAGDRDAVATAIEGATEAERRTAGTVLVDDRFGVGRIPRELLHFASSADQEVTPERAAAGLAVLGTTWKPHLRYALGWPLQLDEHTERVVLARGRAFATAIMDRRRLPGFEWVRMLMRLGLAERPPDAVYLPAVAHALSWQAQRHPEDFIAWLRREPDLIDDAWRVLAELPALAAETHRVRGDEHAGMLDPPIALLRASGDMPRDRLLDVVLDALSTDSGASVWLGRLLDDLAPTAVDLPRLAATYLRVVAQPDPAAQKEGLARLRALLDAGAVIDTGDLAASLRRPLVGQQKNLALAALKVLDRLAAERPSEVGVVLEAAADGLTHARADVQERTLLLLERHWPNNPPTAAVVADVVAQLVDLVAAPLRERVRALTAATNDAGLSVEVSTPSPSLDELSARIAAVDPAIRDALGLDTALGAVLAGSWPAPVRFAADAAPVLDPGRALPTVTDDDELIALWAGLLEGEGAAWEVEQALAGMAERGAALAAAGRVAPLAARATAIVDPPIERAGQRPPSWSLRSMSAGAVLIWASGEKDATARWLQRVAAGDTRHTSLHPDNRYETGPDGDIGGSTAITFVGLRMLETAAKVAAGDTQPLLATATHAGGWVDAAVLAQRATVLRNARRGTGRIDLIAAALRVAPRPGLVEVVARARGSLFAAIAHALGAGPAPDDPGVAAAGRRVAIDHLPLVALDLPIGLEHEPDARRAVSVAVTDLPPFRRDDPVAGVLHRLLLDGGARADLRQWHAGLPVFGGVEAGSAEVAAWVAPRQPDLAAAASILVSSASVDVTKYHQRGDRIVAGLADPDVPLGRLGSIAVAMALANVYEPAAAAGLDLFLEAAEDGRLDPDAVAEGWAALDSVGGLRAGRLDRPLSEAARASDRAAAAVVRTVTAHLERLDDVPRDVHALLEPMLDASVRTGVGVTSAPARARLEAIATASRTSKRGRLARQLLDSADTGEAACHCDALNAQVERAERWAGSPS